MMKRNIDLFLHAIIEAIQRIEAYTSGQSKEDFYSNSLQQDAVLRRLEIIGEAVKHIPKDVREKYPSLPWRDIAGTRDILVHEYFEVDLELMWSTIKERLPELKVEVSKILEDLDTIYE